MKVLLDALQLDSAVYLLHSLRRGGATFTYRASLYHLHIKHHSMWSSDVFWAYMAATCITDSPVAVELAAVIAPTL